MDRSLRGKEWSSSNSLVWPFRRVDPENQIQPPLVARPSDAVICCAVWVDEGIYGGNWGGREREGEVLN